MGDNIFHPVDRRSEAYFCFWKILTEVAALGYTISMGGNQINMHANFERLEDELDTLHALLNLKEPNDDHGTSVVPIGRSRKAA